MTTVGRARGPTSKAGPLRDEIAASVGGDIRFDQGSRALYATTGSNYRQVPLGVVVPHTVDDLVRGLAVCRQFGVDVLLRGGGTSLAGQTCNEAIVFDTSKYLTAVLEIDPERRLARVQPGAVLDDLRRAAAPHGLTFGPDPSTHAYCTLGGMIGNNSCGVRSVTAGRTADNVQELEVVTGDGTRLRVGPTPDRELERLISAGGRIGEIYAGLARIRDQYGDLIRARYPAIPRRVSGFGLDELLPERGFHVARALVGTEGTCVTVLEATLRLVDEPRHRVMLVMGFVDVYAAADHVPLVLEAQPLGLEGMDDRLVDDARRQALHVHSLSMLPEGAGWLIAEFGGATPDEARAPAEALQDRLRRQPSPPSIRLLEEASERHAIWLVRESGLGATAHVPGEPLTWEGWEDSAVHPNRLGAYLRDLRALLDRFEYSGDLYGHFGDGCVHTRIDFDLTTDHGIRKFRSFLDEGADLIVRYGGSFSGEHGDGLARGALLPKLYGPDLMRAFREFRELWDPEGRLNPRRKVDADPPDAHLRLGAGYEPARPETWFAYRSDNGSFGRAILRCVGVGACRKTDSGTMCPSYMVTRDEEHSTRGRARLLFEMLQADVVRDGWLDEQVKDALDLCLSCKGCKHECPVRVDMANYKAEFLAHYYSGRWRPLQAYAFGFVPWWLRLADYFPWTAHQISRSRWAAALLKYGAGVAPARRIPVATSRSFRSRFRAVRPDGRRRAVLWPDTFTDHFHPGTAAGAAALIQRAGFHVVLPSRPVCCGRPLYDYGMLDVARRVLRQTLDVLRPELESGTPVIVLEPGCASVFRDELQELFPGDRDAERLGRSTRSLAEFLDEHAARIDWPAMSGEAILHGHCHQKALAGMDADASVLRRLGLRVRTIDAGCCGMAGAFGFDSSHYAVSVAAGERVLLPHVREAHPATLIVADGFSCREQIAQLTPRRALHVADVLRLAADRELQHPDPFIESRLFRSDERAERDWPSIAEAGWLAGMAGAVAVAAWQFGAGRRTVRRSHG